MIGTSHTQVVGWTEDLPLYQNPETTQLCTRHLRRTSVPKHDTWVHLAHASNCIPSEITRVSGSHFSEDEQKLTLYRAEYFVIYRDWNYLSWNLSSLGWKFWLCFVPGSLPSICWWAAGLQENTSAVRETGVSQHNGNWFRALFKFLNTVVLWCSRGFRGP